MQRMRLGIILAIAMIFLGHHQPIKADTNATTALKGEETSIFDDGRNYGVYMRNPEAGRFAHLNIRPSEGGLTLRTRTMKGVYRLVESRSF